MIWEQRGKSGQRVSLVLRFDRAAPRIPAHVQIAPFLSFSVACRSRNASPESGSPIGDHMPESPTLSGVGYAMAVIVVYRMPMFAISAGVVRVVPATDQRHDSESCGFRVGAKEVQEGSQPLARVFTQPRECSCNIKWVRPVQLTDAPKMRNEYDTSPRTRQTY
jgi:hypothetical protein